MVRTSILLSGFLGIASLVNASGPPVKVKTLLSDHPAYDIFETIVLNKIMTCEGVLKGCESALKGKTAVFTATWGNLPLEIQQKIAGYLLEDLGILAEIEKNVGLPWSKFEHSTRMFGFKRVTSAVFDCSGSYLVTASDDATAIVWDLKANKCLGRFYGHAGQAGMLDAAVKSAAFDSEGKRIVTASHDGTAKICTLDVIIKKKEHSLTLEGHNEEVVSAVFSQDDTKVATASYDNTAKIWDAQKGTCLLTLMGHESAVRSVTFDKDGSMLLTGSKDKTVKLWDIKNGECIRSFEGHTGEIMSVVFDNIGKRAITGSDDTTIKIWDVETGECMRTLKGHTGEVWCVTYHEKSNTIVSASEDKTVKFWDLDTGTCTYTMGGHETKLPLHDNFVWSAVLDRTGKKLATTSANSFARIWHLDQSDFFDCFFNKKFSIDQAIIFIALQAKLRESQSDKTLDLTELAHLEKAYKDLPNQAQEVLKKIVITTKSSTE